MSRAQPPPRSTNDDRAMPVATSMAPVRPAVSVPAGAPAWVTSELLDQTIKVWQPYDQHALTAQDALEMMLNVGHLFDVLSRGNDHEAVRRSGPRVEP